MCIDMHACARVHSTTHITQMLNYHSYDILPFFFPWCDILSFSVIQLCIGSWMSSISYDFNGEKKQQSSKFGTQVYFIFLIITVIQQHTNKSRIEIWIVRIWLSGSKSVGGYLYQTV